MMLDSFKISRHFNKLHASLYVEIRTRGASLLLMYGGRIIRNDDLRPADYGLVETPEKAEAFLSRDMGERGSFMEFWEWQCRCGELSRVPA